MADAEVSYAGLPWLQPAGQQLAAAMHQQQLAHAWLLQGAQGIGKRRLAERLAALLLCAQPADDQPCGQCRSCQLIAAGTHPDRIVLEPEEAGKPIKIDAVRELVKQLQLTPQVAKRKVVILDPAEAMNVNAANALLKTLEEPPGEAYLLLLSHVPGRLLATIRSRCQKLQLAAPTLQASRRWLQQQRPVTDEALDAALLQSGGTPLKALDLLQEEQGNGPSLGALTQDLQALLHRKQSVIEVAARWAQQDARSLLQLWQRLLEQELRLHQNDQQAGSFMLAPQALFRMHDVLRDAQAWLNVPLQQALLWEDLLTRWQRLHSIQAAA